jgi:hypothetical protein
MSACVTVFGCAVAVVINFCHLWQPQNRFFLHFLLLFSHTFLQLQRRSRAWWLRVTRAPDVFRVRRLREGQLHAHAGRRSQHRISSNFKHELTCMQAGGVEKAVSFNGGAQMSSGDRWHPLARHRILVALTLPRSIVLRGVPIKTPNGDTLVESMHLTVRAAAARLHRPQVFCRFGRAITRSLPDPTAAASHPCLE